MKTCSRFIITSLILTALLWAMVVSAQERSKPPATTINRQPSVVLQTRTATQAKPVPTPTPNPRFKFPSKAPVKVTLPDALKDRDQQKQDYPRMPGVIGIEVRKAESAVRQVQPNARIFIKEGQYTNNYGPGIVVNHSPERGSVLRPGAEVVLYYNPQSPSNNWTIPNLRGMDVEVAEQVLRRPFPRLVIQRVSVNDTSVRPNTVARHLPGTGQPYNAKTEVTLYFRPADPPPTPTVLVPDVQGMSVLDARRRLSRNNLGAGLPRLQENFDNYIITGQSPEAGARVPVRSIVTLTVRPVVTVPDLTRRTLDDARQVLSQNRLQIGSVVRRQSAAGANEVLSQDPLPNSVVFEGTTVNLVVAVQRRVRVPDVRNQPRSTAAQSITNAGLVVGQIETQESSAAIGTVIGQNPAAGDLVIPGSQVNLTVAIPQTAQVPNLRGRIRDAATQMITNAGLAVGQVATQESSSAPGTVLSQNPSAGARVTVGSQVNLTVAIPQTVQVPNLRGRIRDAATQMITNAGLAVGQVATQESSSAPGTVLSQNPLPGARVTVGSQVNLVIAVPQTVQVPNLGGKLRDVAAQMVRSAGLVVGQVTTQESNAGTGSVLGQTPAAGTSVTVGSQVNLVIAIPLPVTPTPTVSTTLPVTPTPTVTPTPVTFVVVPDVRKKELTEAISLLRAVQLDVGDVPKKDQKETASSVLEQSPLPGQLVAVGTRVNLMIGKPDGGLIKELPKVLGVLGMGFAAFLLGRLWKYLRTKGSRITDPEPLPPSALSFRTTMNSSSPEFAASTELQTSFALQFQPRADWGQQYITLTGGLITAESEEL